MLEDSAPKNTVPLLGSPTLAPSNEQSLIVIWSTNTDALTHAPPVNVNPIKLMLFAANAIAWSKTTFSFVIKVTALEIVNASLYAPSKT